MTTATTMPKLGIIAGGGDIPALLINACKAQKREYFVLAFEGHANPEIIGKEAPQAWIRLGETGTGFKLLHEQNVKEIVMVGAIRRPTLSDLKPDWRTTKFFAKIGTKALGDDGLLSAVIREVEGDGFKVVGVDSLLSELLSPVGVWGKIHPDEQASIDINRGLDVAKGLGELDVGQAVVVQQGLVLAVEAIEGTDAMISRCVDLKREGLGGVLVKVKKPRQERRADLPTIGMNTIANAAKAGLRGVAVEAGHSLVVDKEAVAQYADSLGLFVIGI